LRFRRSADCHWLQGAAELNLRAARSGIRTVLALFPAANDNQYALLLVESASPRQGGFLAIRLRLFPYLDFKMGIREKFSTISEVRS